MASILCKHATALCATPLAGFVLLTFATQVPLAVGAALGLSGLLGGCQGAQWLAGMLGAALAHLLASVYVAIRVANRTDAALRDRHSSMARISYLLCHDPCIALYLLVVGFFAVWLTVGSVWSLAGSLDASVECDPDLGDRVALALWLGWGYFCAAPMVFACTLCCVCCDGTDYAANDAEFAAKTAEQEARKQKRGQGAAIDGDDHGDDVEALSAPPKLPPAPPGNYTAEGIPIGIPIPNDKDGAVVDAVVAEPLPPPTAPPMGADTTPLMAEWRGATADRR